MTKRQNIIYFWVTVAMAWAFLLAAEIYNSLLALSVSALLAIISGVFFVKWIRTNGGDPPGPIQPA